MKKHVHLLKAMALSLAMVMLLSACGGSNSGNSGNSPANNPSGNPSGNSGASSATEDDIGFVRGETLLLIIPGSAGGGSDLGIRFYGQALTDVYGITTTFENYNNTIGHQMTADAKPDGTTLTIATGALNIQYITGQATVDPMNDFTLIACLQDNGISAIAAPVNAPYNTFDEFVEYAKAHPGELNVGMPSSGSNTMFYGMLQQRLGITLNAVECANESDRLTNLAGGFIDIGTVGVGNALEYEQAGMLKVIGTHASDGIKSSQYPQALPDNYKTLQEQGYENLYFNVYHYLLGPAGMDPTQVAHMNAAMEKIVEVVADDIDSIGNIHGWHNLEESAKIRQQEYDDLVQIAKDMGTYVQG